jgi:hypothetical protein
VTALASAPPRVGWIDEHATGLLADSDAWRPPRSVRRCRT